MQALCMQNWIMLHWHPLNSVRDDRPAKMSFDMELHCSRMFMEGVVKPSHHERYLQELQNTFQCL